jgi:hypothetical protein
VPNVGGGGTFRGWGLVEGHYVIGDKLSEGTRIVLVGLSVLQEGYLKKKTSLATPQPLGPPVFCLPLTCALAIATVTPSTMSTHQHCAHASIMPWNFQNCELSELLLFILLTSLRHSIIATKNGLILSVTKGVSVDSSDYHNVGISGSKKHPEGRYMLATYALV